MRFLVAAVLLTGCAARVEFTVMDPPPHATPPRTPESVEVLTTTEPTRGHVMTGTLELADPVADHEATTRKLRYEAAQHGCDAILFSTATSQSATCIVYRDSVPGPAAKPLGEAPMHGGY